MNKKYDMTYRVREVLGYGDEKHMTIEAPSKWEAARLFWRKFPHLHLAALPKEIPTETPAPPPPVPRFTWLSTPDDPYGEYEGIEGFLKAPTGFKT
jgi:hypothetical protein